MLTTISHYVRILFYRS